MDAEIRTKIGDRFSRNYPTGGCEKAQTPRKTVRECYLLYDLLMSCILFKPKPPPLFPLFTIATGKK